MFHYDPIKIEKMFKEMEEDLKKMKKMVAADRKASALSSSTVNGKCS